MLLKLRDQKGLRRATELIGEVMKKHGIPRTDAAPVDYCEPYRTSEELVADGLIKVILPNGHTIDEHTILERLNVGRHLEDIKAAANDSDDAE